MELVDLETGHLLLSAKAVPSDLPTAFYEAFEADRSLREPLLFDTGHPDAEGMRLFARSVADALLKEGALGAGGSGSRKG
jgi:lysophospholipase L1-like esterase